MDFQATSLPAAGLHTPVLHLFTIWTIVVMNNFGIGVRSKCVCCKFTLKSKGQQPRGEVFKQPSNKIGRTRF